MIQSMTGYGRYVAEWQGKKIHVEIKSLNSKALDLSAKIAPLYREKEMEIRQSIAQRLERGKIDLTIWTEKTTVDLTTPVNRPVLSEYFRQVNSVAQESGIADPSSWFHALLRFPDILAKTEVEELSEEDWSVTHNAVTEAIDSLVAFRQQEGKALYGKFVEKVENIRSLLASIEPFEKGRVDKIRQRITDGLRQIPEVQYDANRLEQEMIYYIEKLDISEEKQRLSNHLDYFLETMRDGHGQGKKLGFIAQEMGREINTMGSKSNQAEMQNIVVKMKDELEQIKEQVLNVL